MEHVVFFPAVDGTPAFRRVPSLDEAVRLVEHLRNREGVVEASVHALTDVPLSFRAYYHVEVPGPAGAEQPSAVQGTDEPVAGPVQEEAPVAAEADEVQELLEDSPAEDVSEPAAVEERLDEPIAEVDASAEDESSAADAPPAADATHDPRHLEAVSDPAPSSEPVFAPPVGPAVSAPLLELVPSQATASEHAASATLGTGAAASVAALPVGVPFGEPARSLGFFS